MNVKTNSDINTIVIGWANLGFLWGKKVMIVYVRESRYTHELLQKTDKFTLSVPLQNDLKKELHFCGVNSGRDFNKFEKCHLTPIIARKVDSIIVGECDLHYECRIIHRQRIDNMNSDILYRYYQNEDYHIAYFCEIKDCYLYKKD